MCEVYAANVMTALADKDFTTAYKTYVTDLAPVTNGIIYISFQCPCCDGLPIQLLKYGTPNLRNLNLP